MPFLSFSMISSIFFLSQINGGAIIKASPVGLIFIPAFNVENKILKVLKKIPKNVFRNYNSKIIIIEDCSVDNTLEIVNKITKNKFNGIKIKLIRNKKNKGYGGVQKIAFNYAIKNKFKFIVMLHGDDQYPANKILNLIKPLTTNKYDAVFGSRMINSIDALKGGMPFYKFLGNIALTFFQNLILSAKLSEYHSGYRSYKVSSLRQINYRTNTNDFHSPASDRLVTRNWIFGYLKGAEKWV